MLQGWPMIVIGGIMVILGFLAFLGVLDRVRFGLYKNPGGEQPSVRDHRTLQRGGGLIFLLGGLIFIFNGISG